MTAGFLRLDCYYFSSIQRSNDGGLSPICYIKITPAGHSPVSHRPPGQLVVSSTRFGWYCLGRVRLLCIKIARLDNPAPNVLRLELMGTTCKWPVYVDCDEEQLCLPMVWTKPPESPLAHVSYAGVVCIDDGQGLSLDPERRAEIVAHTVLKAYDLLERSASDASSGYTKSSTNWRATGYICRYCALAPTSRSMATHACSRGS